MPTKDRQRPRVKPAIARLRRSRPPRPGRNRSADGPSRHPRGSAVRAKFQPYFLVKKE